jgi:quinol monooxygenase YgiN
MSLDDIPLFPEWCVQHAQQTVCDHFGLALDCVPSFPQTEAFKITALHGHMLVVVLLICIGSLTLSFVDWSDGKAHFMKITMGLYALITAGFAFARNYWGVSQLLLVGAALHNMCEWFMFVQCSTWASSPDALRLTIYKSIFFIFAILVAVVVAPTLMMSVAVEQTFGIMMDFGLVLIYGKGFLANINHAGKDSIDTGDAGSKKKGESIKHHQLGLGNFYAVPLLSHSVHLFGTILPLVFVNFHALTVTWFSSYFLEASVYLTVPTTHMLYMHWSIVFDRIRADSTIKDNPSGVLPKRLRVTQPVLILVVAFALGLIPLALIPKVILGDCVDDVTCPASDVIVGTAVATVHPGFGPAFEDWVAKNDLVNKARAQKGNSYYQMNVNRQNPNEYRFVEHWASREALNGWLSGFPKQMFSNKITRNLLVGGKLAVQGYQPTKPARCITKDETVDGSLYMHTGASCDKVWSVMGDWTTCSWVIGCDYTTVSKEDPKVRTLFAGKYKTKEIRHAHSDKDKTFTYEVLEATSKFMEGFTASARLVDSGEGCDFLYNFKTTSKDKLEAIYNGYLDMRIPALQKMFEK